ncbi:hypothetical protein MIB92_17680 [Aestuariirhabdus sp. Z084]|uniref:hypothetical protein n=1 Tax=Aestuariirhabdus haliotis TaxID=2918751 RepID=UPI00201B3AC8|nr:hypothetical protein [Aestuariirhabdus haliotis]MCL6417496.1 hypothetical protein [Aestuariirhabdus haliotis]MCL6421460.1 hypothetical protein [Aestuariirhabdus haliotis]
MTFTLVATVIAVAGLLLGLGWLCAGHLLFKRWRIEPNPAGLLVGRRIGAVYLGLAIIFWLGRNAPPSELRVTLCVGALFVMVLLAALGLFEYRARRAGSAILISVALEVVIAIGLINVLVF